MQAEIYRYRVFYTYCFTTLLTRIPFRHRLDDTYGLLVERRVSTRANYLYIHNRTVFVYHKLADYTTLDAVLLRNNRIFHVLAQVFEQRLLTAGEFWQLLRKKEGENDGL